MGKGQALFHRNQQVQSPDTLLTHPRNHHREAPAIQRLIGVQRGRDFHANPLSHRA